MVTTRPFPIVSVTAGVPAQQLFSLPACHKVEEAAQIYSLSRFIIGGEIINFGPWGGAMDGSGRAIVAVPISHTILYIKFGSRRQVLNNIPTIYAVRERVLLCLI